MTLKHLAASLAFLTTLGLGMVSSYRIGQNQERKEMNFHTDQFKTGWQRGYTSGFDAGTEKTLYYTHHTPAYKQGWNACMEQF